MKDVRIVALENMERKIANHFNRMLLYSFITAGITALIGLILLILPASKGDNVIGIMAGCAFLISGASAIYKYFYRDGAKLYSLNLIFGILYVLLGLAIIIFPHLVVNFVTICLGIYLIVSGAMKISYGFWLRKGEEDSWLITLVTGIMLIVLGILVIYNPFVKLAIPKLTGAFLLITSALDINDTVLLKKRAKKITDIFW